MEIIELINLTKAKLLQELDKNELLHGEIIYNNGDCQILSQSLKMFEVLVNNENNFVEYKLIVEDNENIYPKVNKATPGWDRFSYAGLLQVENELHSLDTKEHLEHKKYSREGMIRRVLNERKLKANKADYKIKWASNIYGNHILTNERGVKYKVFLRDFEKETGYTDSMDSKLNKLGTTKHLMFAFETLKNNKSLYKRLSKKFPFIEIYPDPLNDYKITWFYPNTLPVEEQLLISKYFKSNSFIEDEEITSFLGFIEEAQENELFCIRPEVNEKIERAFEKAVLKELSEKETINLDFIKTDLYDYQKEGVEFAVFRKAAIIADEMGLGKTIQAISVAVLKKQIFDFQKTLIICPASIKEQWKNEIEKFTNEKAIVIKGTPEEREEQYKDKESFFFIVNYETVLRDHREINNAGVDFMILDEAQRVKNYETKTASAVKKLNPKHILVITGTPIENRLIDIFSIVSIIDPYFFGPLWEFSYQHCIFDTYRHNKINGYYNLQELNKKLEEILIRREKRKVLDQLPSISQMDIPVNLTELQEHYHSHYARGIAKIIHKKFLTPFDLQLLQMLLAKMRMVCDSTYLIDEETNESPKLDELEYLLLNKIDIKNSSRKIIIFSEWVKVLKLVGRMLRENDIGFVELTGKVPVKLRGDLIRKFETDDNIQIFLSSEAGGSGLNLQVADTVINFELPWNPAKKNQRIGRIDRLGQKNDKLTVINFITRNSIEMKIAGGLLVKQNLFDGVLDSNSTKNYVDFSSKGRSQFIDELENLVDELKNPVPEDEILSNDEQAESSTTTPIDENVITEEAANKSLNGEIEEAQTFNEEEVHSESDEKSITENSSDNENAEVEENNKEKQVEKAQELEQVMNNGMQFLSGLFKMSTGKDAGFENQKIEVNKETGEVTMKFKLPGF